MISSSRDLNTRNNPIKVTMKISSRPGQSWSAKTAELKSSMNEFAQKMLIGATDIEAEFALKAFMHALGTWRADVVVSVSHLFFSDESCAHMFGITATASGKEEQYFHHSFMIMDSGVLIPA